MAEMVPRFFSQTRLIPHDLAPANNIRFEITRNFRVMPESVFSRRRMRVPHFSDSSHVSASRAHPDNYLKHHQHSSNKGFDNDPAINHEKDAA
jgi:hypothetical protein